MYTIDGCCPKGHMPRTEVENFQVIKIDVPATTTTISLNNLVSNHFAEETTTFLMKCSDCCKHTARCPQSGECKLKEATNQKCLVSSPDLLYIQLLRFEDFQSPKIQTKVFPENILVLPNNDKYKLVSIGNHLGSFINNGHYQALIKFGTNWMKTDDNQIMKTKLITEINEENYIFVYQKFSTTAPFIATNYWQEVFEDQPVPPGLHIQRNTHTGKKYAKVLDAASQPNGQYYKKKEYTEGAILENETEKTEDNVEKKIKNVKIKKETTEANEDTKTEATHKLNLSSLDSNNWLNDEVINEYMQLLNTMDKDVFMFTSFFHTAFREGGFEKVKNYYRKHDLLNCKTLYIPVHQNSHWFLITFHENELVAYDPYNYPQSSEHEKTRLLKKNVQNIMVILNTLETMYFKPMFKLKNKKYKKFILSVKVPPQIPPQNNSSDCGVFLLTLTRCLVLNQQFCTYDMVTIRTNMKKELQTRKIDRNVILNSKDKGNSTQDNTEFKESNPHDKPSQMLHDEENVQCFMFNNFGVEILVETIGNRVTCISCLDLFARIDLHFKKSQECNQHVEMITFWNAYNDYKKEDMKMKKKIRNKRYRDRKKEQDLNFYKEEQNVQNKKFRDTKKEEDPNLYK